MHTDRPAGVPTHYHNMAHVFARTNVIRTCEAAHRGENPVWLSPTFAARFDEEHRSGEYGNLAAQSLSDSIWRACARLPARDEGDEFRILKMYDVSPRGVVDVLVRLDFVLRNLPGSTDRECYAYLVSLESEHILAGAECVN